MKVFLNYLGQLRLYSFVDLALFMYAAGSTPKEFFGVMILWVGFLAFLEVSHGHSYRAKVPKFTPFVLYVIGFILFPKIETVIFILLVHLYAKKKNGWWASLSPFVRGFQAFFLAAGVAGYLSPLPWLAGILTSIRNALGDVRDVKKDGEEGMKTIPVVLGFKHGYPYIHLFSVMMTTTVAWSFSGLPVFYLWLIWAIQGATYDITPR